MPVGPVAPTIAIFVISTNAEHLRARPKLCLILLWPTKNVREAGKRSPEEPRLSGGYPLAAGLRNIDGSNIRFADSLVTEGTRSGLRLLLSLGRASARRHLLSRVAALIF